MRTLSIPKTQGDDVYNLNADEEDGGSGRFEAEASSIFGPGYEARGEREALLEHIVSDMTGRTLRAVLSNLKYAVVLIQGEDQHSLHRCPSPSLPAHVLFPLLARRGNVEGFRVMMQESPGRFCFGHLEDATCKFVIQLFRLGVLTVEEHAAGVMRTAINRARQQGVVEFLHRRYRTPLPFDAVCTPCGLRTVLMLAPRQAAAFRGEGERSLLDNYILLQWCFPDPAALDEDVRFLLSHGCKFSRAMATPEYIEKATALPLVAAWVKPENYEDGDRLTAHMTMCAHVILSLHSMHVFRPLINPASIPEAMRQELGLDTNLFRAMGEGR